MFVRWTQQSALINGYFFRNNSLNLSHPSLSVFPPLGTTSSRLIILSECYSHRVRSRRPQQRFSSGFYLCRRKCHKSFYIRHPPCSLPPNICDDVSDGEKGKKKGSSETNIHKIGSLGHRFIRDDCCEQGSSWSFHLFSMLVHFTTCHLESNSRHRVCEVDSFDEKKPLVGD